MQPAPAPQRSPGSNPMRPGCSPFMTACSPVRLGCTQAAPCEGTQSVCISGAARLLRGVQLVRPDHALASRAVPDHARTAQIGSRDCMAKSAHARKSPQKNPAVVLGLDSGPGRPEGRLRSWALVPAPCPSPCPSSPVRCAFRLPGGALTKLKQREAAKLALRRVEVMSMPGLE